MTRIITFFKALPMILMLISCKEGVKENGHKLEFNNLTPSNWVTLFDGKTFNGWHGYLQDSISDQWHIEDESDGLPS